RVRGGKSLPTAVFSVMSLCIIWLVSGRVQHGQNFVGSAEASGLQHWRCHRSERFELLARIGSQIDLRALQAGVSEPKGDFSDVASCLECMHGARVSQNVRTNAFGGDVWHFVCGLGSRKPTREMASRVSVVA